MTSRGSHVSTIIDSEITDNKVSVKAGGTGAGGGLNARDPITITRTAISGNKADEGGGVSLTPDLEVRHDHSTHDQRQSRVRGAGVNIGTQDPVSFINTTISRTSW